MTRLNQSTTNELTMVSLLFPQAAPEHTHIINSGIPNRQFPDDIGCQCDCCGKTKDTLQGTLIDKGGPRTSDNILWLCSVCSVTYRLV